MATSTFQRILTGLGALLLAAAATAQATGADPGGSQIDVVITGIQPRGGELIVALYDSADHWFKPAKARLTRTLKVDGATAALQFEGLPPGDYGVAVIHDTNGNGKLDFSWFPLPRPIEGSGISNNPRTFVGPPSFKQARLALAGIDQTIAISLVY